MNQETVPTSTTPVASAADVAYRHIVLAHYRLATADGIEPELAADCIDELNAAMDALAPLLPPRERNKPATKRA